MKKIKNFAKKLFSAKRMKTLAMLLFCGTLATYAQNAAGDYTAGTDALATVTEEIAKYVPFVVKLCNVSTCSTTFILPKAMAVERLWRISSATTLRVSTSTPVPSS